MENKRKQCAYLLEQYFVMQSYARAQAVFQTKFGIPTSNKSTIKRTVDRFQQLSTCDDGYYITVIPRPTLKHVFTNVVR